MNNKTKKWIDTFFKKDVKEKNVFITGGNSGVGLETAKDYLYLGANVYLLVRNIEKGLLAKNDLLKQFPNSHIEIIELDLADFASIRKCVDYIVNNNIDVDVFINNAGVFHLPKSKTKDDIEIIMGTNTVGTFYLNELLKPYLKRFNHRVDLILTSSLVSRFAKLDYNDFYMDKRYGKIKIYNRSKLAVNEIYLYYLDEYKDSNVLVHLTHPGITNTPIIHKAYKVSIFNKLGHLFIGTFFHSPSKASLGNVYVLNKDEPTLEGPRGLFQMSGYPKVVKYKFIKDYKPTIEIIKNTINNVK